VDPAGHDRPADRRARQLVLLRTLSTGYSLEGLRFGHAIGSPGVIAPMLEKARDSWNVDVIAQRMAAAALTARAYSLQTRESVRSERTRVQGALIAPGPAGGREPVELPARLRPGGRRGRRACSAGHRSAGIRRARATSPRPAQISQVRHWSSSSKNTNERSYPQRVRSRIAPWML
jgi:histidinol-phosphate aminotransferase